MEYTKKLLALTSKTITRHEISLIIEILDQVLKLSERNHVRDNILQLVKDDTPTLAFQPISHAGAVKRVPRVLGPLPRYSWKVRASSG